MKWLCYLVYVVIKQCDCKINKEDITVINTNKMKVFLWCVSYLAGGGARLTVFNGFADSQEFHGVCTACGIRQS